MRDTMVHLAKQDPLTVQLLKAGIPLNEWGKGSVKSVAHLQSEIDSGEATLIERDGRLFRSTSVVRIDVRSHSDDGTPYTLQEDRQLFSQDGTVRRRPTPWGIWEKMFQGRDATTEALRALEKELGLVGLAVKATGQYEGEAPPMDYPGLPTLICCYDFIAEVPTETLAKHLAGELPKEETQERTTYFSWRRMPLETDTLIAELSILPHALLRDRLLVSAENVHRQLLLKSQSVPSRVMLNELFTSGEISEALSSFPGSSTYLMGAFYPSGSTFAPTLRTLSVPQRDVARTVRDECFYFLYPKGVMTTEWIENFAVVNLPYAASVEIKFGENHHSISLLPLVSEQHNPSAFTRRARTLAAVVSLEIFSKTLPSTGGYSSLIEPLPETMRTLRSLTTRVAAEICNALYTRSERVVVGESFTFGMLASLLSPPVNAPLEFAYGWYDSRLKKAVGVPEKCLTEMEIAKPETVIAGAKGLFRLAPNASIALATSGWAGHLSLPNDTFSVAIACREAERLTTHAIQVDVRRDPTCESQYLRRALCRELGVVASLLMLARHVDGLVSAEVEQELMSCIHSFGVNEQG